MNSASSNNALTLVVIYFVTNIVSMISKERLRKLTDRFKPEKAMMNMLMPLIPQLGGTLEKLEKPVEEGGVLLEGEDKVAFVVVKTHQEPSLAICALAKRDEGMLITRTLSSGSLEQLFQDGGEGN